MTKRRKSPHISRENWDSVDSLPLTQAMLESMSPVEETFPDLAQHSQKRKRGRPAQTTHRQMISFRLDPALIADIKATGKGYNARVEKALKDALTEGKL